MAIVATAKIKTIADNVGPAIANTAVGVASVKSVELAFASMANGDSTADYVASATAFMAAIRISVNNAALVIAAMANKRADVSDVPIEMANGGQDMWQRILSSWPAQASM